MTTHKASLPSGEKSAVTTNTAAELPDGIETLQQWLERSQEIPGGDINKMGVENASFKDWRSSVESVLPTSETESGAPSK